MNEINTSIHILYYNGFIFFPNTKMLKTYSACAATFGRKHAYVFFTGPIRTIFLFNKREKDSAF